MIHRDIQERDAESYIVVLTIDFFETLNVVYESESENGSANAFL